jgi:hypothetical protein
MAARDNTAKLAKALWNSRESYALAPHEFQAKFDALYAASEGIATLWHLGGAANDYLRGHPGSISVPSELAPALLASRLVNGRIIGLKLLNRSSSDETSILSWICRALDARNESEVLVGLCELREFLERRPPVTILPVHELLPRLERLQSSRDTIMIGPAANRLLDWLREIVAGSPATRG